MNNVQLFFKYFGAQLRADRRKFMLILLSTLIVIAAYYIFCASLTGVSRESIMGVSKVVFNIALFLTIVVAISKSFRDYHRPLIATRAMMLPVSRAQKFLYILLTYLIIVPVGLYGLYYLQNIAACAILDLPYSWGESFVNFSSSLLLNGDANVLNINIYQEFLFQASYVMVCAVVFRRLQFLFAILISAGLGLVLFSGVFFAISSGELAHDLVDWGTEFFVTYNTWADIIFIVLFLTIAWFRFNSLQLKK